MLALSSVAINSSIDVQYHVCVVPYETVVAPHNFPTTSHGAIARTMQLQNGIAVGGDNGLGVKSWIDHVLGKELAFPHMRILYPSAPERPYTAANGQLQAVWFDREQISPFAEENHESIDDMCGSIEGLINVEVKNGIPRNQIALGGFSMGGALSLYYGMRHGRDLAGLFCLSSFLGEHSCVYEALERCSGERLPPMFQCHGRKDPLVPFDWGVYTFAKLQGLGVDTVFHTFPNLYHEMNKQEVTLLREWLTNVIPNDVEEANL